MVGTLILFLFSIQFNFLNRLESSSPYALSVICIGLCLVKLPQDIKRLANFGQPKVIDTNQLDKFQVTRREKEVLQLLIQGKTYKEIGEELFISLPTVKTHVSRIYEKLQVRNRLELSNLVKQS
ncbi:hypothetical protein GF376_03720 [Candidatus Peregrinibacteria bacterium]|nr:hypothetical protein [Candidatus Peregrinibacteria bacterium]